MTRVMDMRAGRDDGGSTAARRQGDCAPSWARPALALGLALTLAGCGSEELRVEASAPSTTAVAADPAVRRTPRPLENIRNLDLRSQILADPKVPAELRQTVEDCTMCGLGDPVYDDLTKDRTDDVLVPIEGANDREGYLVYTVVESEPHLLLAYDGAGAELVPKDGDLLLTERMYAETDPWCCPSGHDRVRRFTWNGQRMIVASTSGDEKGFAPYGNGVKVVS